MPPDHKRKQHALSLWWSKHPTVLTSGALQKRLFKSHNFFHSTEFCTRRSGSSFATGCNISPSLQFLSEFCPIWHTFATIADFWPHFPDPLSEARKTPFLTHLRNITPFPLHTSDNQSKPSCKYRTRSAMKAPLSSLAVLWVSSQHTQSALMACHCW